MNSSVIVRVSHRYAAPAPRVFDAWLTPAQAARFLFSTRTGNIMRCQMDARVGGSFLVTDRRPNADGDESVFDVVHRGQFVEIDRPKRLVFDFSVLPFDEERSTRVVIEVQPLSPAACELTLTHHLGNDADPEQQALTRKGWANMLCALEREHFPRRVGIYL